MKIRTDFVTNSSSSSFIAFTIDNPILVKLFKQYKNDHISIDENKLVAEEYNDENFGVSEIYHGDIANWIADLLEYFSERYDEEQDELVDLIREESNDINSAMVFADIKHSYIVSDGEGTGGFHTVIENLEFVTKTITEDVIVDSGKTLYEVVVSEGDENPQDIIDFIDEFGTTTTGEVYVDSEDEDEEDDDISEELARDMNDKLISIDFSGKIFALTSCEKENKIIQIIEKRGGIVKDHVVKKTDYLIIGPCWYVTTKYDKAVEYNSKGSCIMAITEDEFFALIK